MMKRFVGRIANRMKGARGSPPQPANMHPPSKELASSDSSKASSELLEDDPRYDACLILADHSVPSCIFGEDGLAHHGVPTAVFDLHLVVADTRLAGSKLLDAGYSKKEEPSKLIQIPELSDRFVWDSPMDTSTGDSHGTAVVLLNAQEWHYGMPDSVDAMTDWFPPLHKILDSMMSRWTDETSPRLRGHLAVLINYCYLYVPNVKTQAYAANLTRENQQLHFDQVAETSTADLGTEKCQSHYRMVRDQIRRGEHQPIGPSGVQLFPKKSPKWPVKEPIAGA